VRYTSPASRSELARVIQEMNGAYDFWETGSRASLRELLVNEGLAVSAARAVADEFEPWDYLGYLRRQYRRLRQLDAFLMRVVASDLDRRGLGLRLRYLTGGAAAAQRLVGGKVIPERSGYYVGARMVERYIGEHGVAAALRAPALEFTEEVGGDQAESIQTA
jgi:uncharacterized protein YjaZ